MKIAIASGKGGTGKTTIAVNLAKVLADNGKKDVVYVDCDVEEPNGHIFFKPEIEETIPVGKQVPLVDQEKCIQCGQCAEICEYNAIVLIKDQVLTFPEICHSCGGCWLVCPVHAITEESRNLGTMETGHAGGVRFIHGRINVGQPLTPPVIKAVKERIPDEGIIIVDSPPGTSCPVIESIKGADLVVLATEPTPFGLHDLRQAVQMLKMLKMPFAVAVNRADMGDREVYRFCSMQNISILMEIPDDRRIAEAYSNGELVADVLPEYREEYLTFFTAIEKELEKRNEGIGYY